MITSAGSATENAATQSKLQTNIPIGIQGHYHNLSAIQDTAPVTFENRGEILVNLPVIPLRLAELLNSIVSVQKGI